MRSSDTIIIGAGAAGLMAAKTLSEKNIPFTLLEAGDRIGGRARTLYGLPPVELGPEFLHGETPLTNELMEEFGLSWYDLEFPYHIYFQGKLRALPDFWSRVCDVFRSIRSVDHDLPFTEYIARFDQHSLLDQKIVRSFIQGFDAADLDQISTKAIGQMKAQVCDPKMRRMRRPLQGYGTLLSRMAGTFHDEILFSHRVEKIRWKEGRVSVSGVKGPRETPFELSGKKLLITSSVGVLKTLDLEPFPAPIRSFLGRTEMGHVVKLVGELDQEFFHGFENHTFPFIAAPDHCFTAWWTTTPIHSGLVTAWAGGERARKLEAKSGEEKKQIYIQELASLTGLCPAKLSSWAKKIHHHEWEKDPAFLGAYSYPKVQDGDRIPPETAFGDTLFFAGEAFHEEFSGTIEGAFLTGKAGAERLSGFTVSGRGEEDYSLPLSP